MYVPVPAHGGLTEPISRTVPADEIKDFLAHSETLVKIPVSDADLSTVYRLGDGGLEPLDRPDGLGHVQPRAGRSSSRKQRQALRLDHPHRAAGQRRIGRPAEGRAREAALVNSAGRIVAAGTQRRLSLGQAALFAGRLSNGADRPSRRRHGPGGRRRQDAPGGRLDPRAAAAEASALRQVCAHAARGPHAAGRQGLAALVAFQTRNPLHRAHEYALVYGLETLLRAGHNAGACLNPLIGETKGDDVDADVRMHTYEALIDNRALGSGDSDAELWRARGQSVPDRVMLLGLDIKMFYGGPSEAVMHAIYRQNFGFTDIIIGRKHADAPYHDGKPIWGDFDAQEIFNHLAGELRIAPLRVGFAAYYESAGRVDLMENHPDEKPLFISGKEIRKALVEGRPVDPRIMRPSTAAILHAAMGQK